MEVEKFAKYKDKGLTGLANCGNSCYLNSCLQVLSHTYELNEFLSIGDYKNKLNKKPDSVLIIEWDKLRELIWSDNCTIAPWGFLKSVQKVSLLKDRELFSGYAQNDVHEYLLFMIDSFHMSLAREVDMSIKGKIINKTDQLAKKCYEMMKTMYSKEYSEVLNIFYGIHVSEITSVETNKRLSVTPEPFSVLDLSIPSDVEQPSLFHCIDLYCKKEKLEGENAWYNDKTEQKEVAERGIIFWSLPNILIIDLKRWGMNGRKVNKMVDIPITNVDLSKYVKGYSSETYKYDLYGICNHHGNSRGGHYTAHVKNANGKWYNYNDTNVNEIKEENLITTEAYCFFYRKISSG